MILALCLNTYILLPFFRLNYQSDYEAMVFGFFKFRQIIFISINSINYVGQSFNYSVR